MNKLFQIRCEINKQRNKCESMETLAVLNGLLTFVEELEKGELDE